MKKIRYIICLFLCVVSFGSFCCNAIAVPVSSGLLYMLMQSVFVSMGGSVDASSDYDTIKARADNFQFDQSVYNAFSDGLIIESWEQSDGSVGNFIKLRATQLKALLSGLGYLMGLSTDTGWLNFADGYTTSSGAQGALRNFSDFNCYDAYDSSGKLWIFGVPPVDASFGNAIYALPDYYTDKCVYPTFLFYSNSPRDVVKTITFGNQSQSFRIDSSTLKLQYLYTPSSGSGSQEWKNLGITMGRDNASGVYDRVCLVYDGTNKIVGLMYSNLARGTTGMSNTVTWSVGDLVGNTLTFDAPIGLSLDTKINDWSDDAGAGYYIDIPAIGTVGANTTADVLADSMITALARDGVFTAEGTYAESLTDAVATLDVSTDVPLDPSLPADIPVGLPDLGALLITRFPFSIPWDFGRVFGLLYAEPETPYFEFNMMPFMQRWGVSASNTTFIIDLSDYEIVGTASRWATLIGFCFVLIFATKRLIWTA